MTGLVTHGRPLLDDGYFTVDQLRTKLVMVSNDLAITR